MVNWLNAYNLSGTFITEKAFVELWKKIPNKVQYVNRDVNLDLSKINNSWLYSMIPTITLVSRSTNHSSSTTSEEDDIQEYKEGGELQYIVGNSAIYIRIFCSDEKIFVIDDNSICCYCTNEEEASKLCLKLWENCPKIEERPKEATVKLICYSQGDYYTMDSKIKKVNINLEENYNDDFLPVYKDILSFLDQRDSGLILLYGKMGSGKTSMIRHLCSTHPKDYIVVPTSMATRLSDPDFISFLVSNRDSVFVLEDCEQLLMDRSENMFNGAISNILNMSDGLLSDIMNIKFICTFNADVNKIDPALLRKGRCYAKYEFGDLSEEKVQKLNDKYDLGIEEIKPMTLAEIYNADKTEYSETKKRKKIGF